MQRFLHTVTVLDLDQLDIIEFLGNSSRVFDGHDFIRLSVDDDRRMRHFRPRHRIGSLHEIPAEFDLSVEPMMKIRPRTPFFPLATTSLADRRSKILSQAEGGCQQNQPWSV